MSSSSAPQRSYAPKQPHRQIRSQVRYVPKSVNNQNNHSVSKDPSDGGEDAARPVASLTTSLRSASKGKEKGGGGDGNFLNYLPQDEAVASGFGADAGGLDATESQRVVDVLNEELSKLLKMRPRDFWREVAKNDSLHEFLNSYLQYRHRWYDLPHRGAKETVAGVIVGESELCRRVFMVLYRMSSNRDPGASASDCLSMKEHSALLQEKKLLDLPKLLDICAIYGRENGELTKSLVSNAIKAQPSLQDNLSMVVCHFLNIIHTMYQRCVSSVEVLMSSTGRDHGQLYREFLEVMDFINDAVVTLDAFSDSFKPAALHFCVSFDLSHGSEELLSTLAKLHDSLLPRLHQGIVLVSNNGSDAPQSGSDLQTVDLSLRMLSARVTSLGWKLLDSAYLCDEPIEESLLHTTTKMFPAKVEDPAIRGDIIVQTLKEVSRESLHPFQESNLGGTFLQNLEGDHKILSRIASLQDSGWISIDEGQFRYLAQIATPPYANTYKRASSVMPSSHTHKVLMDEDAIIMDSKISQIKDLLPDYGKGFLSACLHAYDHNPEEVIQRILEGTLHEDLLSLDTSLEQYVPLKSSAPSKNDKGKGLLVTEPVPHTGTAMLPAKKDLTTSRRDTVGPPSSSSTYGRFTRKSNKDSVDSEVLDSKSAEDAVRSAVLAAEAEYEDEYDDSFDDLGLSLVESGFEETESFNDNVNSRLGKSRGPENENSQNSSSRWASQKKPQFYVKDGKNYSYKVQGSVGVFNAQDAALLHQSQRETIHGLGRGGNLPMGAVRKVTESQELDDEPSEAAEGAGRGNPGFRGRGGRGGGGGRNYYRKDRAMKKHFQGLGL